MNLIVIPARYASTRFPGKPLHLIAGRPLVQHVWERCQNCRERFEVVVATDDERIREKCEGFGARVVMTAADHPSGTDRIAEVARHFPEAGCIINVQGDEPLIPPGLIDELARRMNAEPSVKMITAASPCTDEAKLDDPNIVKVVLNLHGEALYFSRSRIPYPRNREETLPWFWHKGIYGYARDFLLEFVSWEPSPLEKCEGLEQLRALDHGASIRVLITDEDSPGVDTPEQAREVERRILSGTAD